MANRSPTCAVLFAICWLVVGAAGCRNATVPNENIAVTPDKSQVAFFERPLALAAARSSSTPVPLVVLLSPNPWKMVIGSDSPTFALYSDGTVIFRHVDAYRSTKLTPSAKESLIKHFVRSTLPAASGRFRATDWSDQPDNDLLVYGHDAPFFITVYGSLDNVDVRSKVPNTVLAAFDRLRHFSVSNAQPWLPGRVEVVLSPYENAPDQSINWPKEWAALTSLTTRKRGDSYSVFIPSSDLPALRSFLATQREKGAVAVGGKKWAAYVRLPFPHEELWMAPNDEIAPENLIAMKTPHR
jgi:hypothetical protein